MQSSRSLNRSGTIELVLRVITPAALLRIPKPIDHPDFIYEVKWDGFRALAYIEGHECRLLSRRGHVFKSWPYLNVELAHSVRCVEAVLDGEIVCLGPDGRSRFNHLLFRRDWPHFMAFDVLWLDGRDLCRLPLIERKAILKGIIPNNDRVRYVEHIDDRGIEFFRAACAMDLEGIVAKWRYGIYQGASTTSWLKVLNSEYAQKTGRSELFAARAEGQGARGRYDAPRLLLV
jgi:bifunctional non-homologous end joining protein LigD